jgi:hypothetical protein
LGSGFAFFFGGAGGMAFFTGAFLTGAAFFAGTFFAGAAFFTGAFFAVDLVGTLWPFIRIDASQSGGIWAP